MAGVVNSGRHNRVAGNATIIYPFDSYCKNGSDVTPTIKGGSGGTFSSTSGMVLDSTTGTIDLSACTPGTYTISYTVPGYNIATDVVTILAASDSSFSYPSLVNIRSGYLIPTITGATGGTFSGSAGLYIDSTTGTIDLAKTSSDYSSFTATYTVGANCPSSTSISLVIMTPFKLRVDIPASGSTSAYLLKPQMSNGSCTINWGDGNIQTVTGDTTHNYASSSSDETYDIEIYDTETSKFEGFNAAWDVSTITSYENSIMQWGDIQWKNNSWFATSLPNGAIPKLRLSAPNGASHKPDLSQVTSLYRLFYNKSKSKNLIWEDVNNNLANWDTSTITNMAEAFVLHGSPSSRPSDSQPNIMQLSNWDTSNVTNMNYMFLGAAVTANGTYTSGIGVDVSNWNTQNVENFNGTFRCKGTLTGVENLRTESCTDMSAMFFSRVFPGNVDTKYVDGALRWDVSKVASFSTFAYNSSGSSGSVFPSKWKLSGDGQDINMSSAFSGFDFDINDSPDLCATKTVNETWYGGTSYTAWDMSNTTNIAGMFRGAGTNAAQAAPPTGYNPNISTWQMSNKFTTMQYFARADGSQNRGLIGIDQDLGHWDVTNVSSPNGLLQIVGFRTATERPNFSTANYDSILSIVDGWGSQAASVNSGVNMDFGFSKYTPGGAAEAGRTALINAGWTISDGGASNVSNNYSMAFDGYNDYIDAGNDASLNITGAITVSAWIKPSTTPASGSFITKHSNYNLLPYGAGVRFYIGSEHSGGSAYSLQQNMWTHLVGVFRPGQSIDLYWNGSLTGGSTTSTSTTTAPTVTNPVTIGSNYNQSTFFNGLIDEVAIWNTALTSQEILDIYNATANNTNEAKHLSSVQGSSLQAWYRMGD